VRTCFGEFVLDDVEKQLLRGGAAVHLTPKAYALLLYLVEQGHRAVSKAELLEHLWPQTFVTEAALTSVIKELRHALGDSPKRPRFVRGVRGFGYAFCADLQPVAEPAPAPGPGGGAFECRVVWRNRELTLSDGANLLGRTHEAAVWVEDASVSRHHAVIRIGGGRAVIEDCGSKNGTFLHGARVLQPRELASGDEFWLGRACLLFLCFEAGGSTGSVSSSDGPEGHG